MLRAILNKSWWQHSTKYQLYGHLPPIRKTIQARQTRRAGHCWRSRDELISDVLLWIPAYGRAKAGRPARTYIQQLWGDTGCNPEDLPETINDRKSGKRGSGISVLVAQHDNDDDNSKHIFLNTHRWSNRFTFNNSIQHKLTKLNGFKYCYVSLTIKQQVFIYTVKWSNS